jgi:hypothetical protein
VSPVRYGLGYSIPEDGILQCNTHVHATRLLMKTLNKCYEVTLFCLSLHPLTMSERLYNRQCATLSHTTLILLSVMSALLPLKVIDFYDLLLFL